MNIYQLINLLSVIVCALFFIFSFNDARERMNISYGKEGSNEQKAMIVAAMVVLTLVPVINTIIATLIIMGLGKKRA